jgi:RNA polymerase sigma-70 factor (ECF subfamily)
MTAKLKHIQTILWELLQGHELVAFDEIYRRYWQGLYSMAYKRVQSREISEEIVQDIFTSLWASRTSSSITNLSAYLFTAVKYKVINHQAKEISRKSYAKEQVRMVREDNSTEETVLLDDLNRALKMQSENYL